MPGVAHALDRLSRYEYTLWRQVVQILFALDNLNRRKPQERRSSRFDYRQERFSPTRPVTIEHWDDCNRCRAVQELVSFC